MIDDDDDDEDDEDDDDDGGDREEKKQSALFVHIGSANVATIVTAQFACALSTTHGDTYIVFSRILINIRHTTPISHQMEFVRVNIF